MADLLVGEGEVKRAAGDLRRRPGGDLGAQIAAVKEGGKVVAIGGAGDRGSRGGLSAVGNGTGGSTVPAAPAGPSGRIAVMSKSGGSGSTLTPDVVLAKIQSAYMPGIKRCYAAYLAKDPTARGRLVLTLDVNETGRTTSPQAAGFPAKDVDDCVTGQMAHWRFPVPKDKDGEETQASYAIELQLVPD